MVFNEMGNLRKGDLSKAKSRPKPNHRTQILLWGPRQNREPHTGLWAGGEAGSSADGVPGAGTLRNSLPFASTMAGRPHMQIGAPAHTERL